MVPARPSPARSQGAGSFATDGTGKLTLTGASTYTGPTTIGGFQVNPNPPFTSGLEIGAGGSLYAGGTLPGTITVGGYNRLLLTRSDTFGPSTFNSPVVLKLEQGGILENFNSFNTLSHLTVNGLVLIHGGQSAQYPAFHLEHCALQRRHHLWHFPR